MMSDTNGFEENSKSPSIKYLPVGTKFTVFEFPALIESPTNAVNALSTNSNGFLLDLSNGQDQSKNLLVLGDKLTFNGLVAEFGTSPRIIGGVSETVNFRSK